jgi:hypothetical protein
MKYPIGNSRRHRKQGDGIAHSGRTSCRRPRHGRTPQRRTCLMRKLPLAHSKRRQSPERRRLGDSTHGSSTENNLAEFPHNPGLQHTLPSRKRRRGPRATRTTLPLVDRRRTRHRCSTRSDSFQGHKKRRGNSPLRFVLNQLNQRQRHCQVSPLLVKSGDLRSQRSVRSRRSPRRQQELQQRKHAARTAHSTTSGPAYMLYLAQHAWQSHYYSLQGCTTLRRSHRRMGAIYCGGKRLSLIYV